MTSRCVRQLSAPSDGQVEPAAQVEVPTYGFCVHAERCVSAHERAGRERLCRYVHRPPLAQRRLEVLSDGNVRLGLKRYEWARLLADSPQPTPSRLTHQAELFAMA